MKKVTLRINQQELAVSRDQTILEAARSIGITIPTLCFKPGLEHFTSCMLCVVYEQRSQRLIPACSMPVSEGMEIETEHPLVVDARRDTLAFLLAEHLGDCTAPCQRTCPAHLNIPLMLRQIREKDYQRAIVTVKKTIPLPATMGRICPAPCEKACKRKYYDEALSICLLKRFVADLDLTKAEPYLPVPEPATGKTVAIVGSGPAGLAAAYYLSLEGHHCTVYDQNPRAGGALRYNIDKAILPDQVLDAEIDLIRQLGVTFILGSREGKIEHYLRLKEQYQAVILAIGSLTQADIDNQVVDLSPQGIQVNKITHQTSRSGIFACGGAIGRRKLAIRSLAEGRETSLAVNQFLHHLPYHPAVFFESVMDKLNEEEIKGYPRTVPVYGRVKSENMARDGYREEEAVKEARRCFNCQCKKPLSCQLRQYATRYQARQPKILTGKKRKFVRLVFENGLVFEEGKCIKCGLCVRIVQRAKNNHLGITFSNRGFDTLLKTPFNKSLDRGLADQAIECVRHCPTGALAWQDINEEDEL